MVVWLSHTARTFLKNFDWLSLAILCSITAIGLMTLTGSTYGTPTLRHIPERQFVWVLVALCGYLIVLLISYSTMEKYAYLLYGINLLLLVVTLVRGIVVRGAASWLAFGGLRFQPSEFMKISVVLALARYLSSRTREHAGHRGAVRDGRQVAVAAALALVPMGLIVKQPDLGTASVLLPVLLAVLYLAGVRIRWLALLVALLLSATLVTYPFLRDYQKERIKTFFSPESDPLGRGYNIIQAEITLGSGGLTGKGWKKGTQTAFQFLPEHHTDFIFASLGEQFGLLGCVVVILFYVMLILRSGRVIGEARDAFGSFLVLGLVVVFTLEVFFNLAMVLRLLPVVGVPLPLISYGGSSLFATYVLFALIQNVRMRRFVF
jgi:rod shape determining protein RodA